MMHDFELHVFFHSPKNVLLKALLYIVDLLVEPETGRCNFRVFSYGLLPRELFSNATTECKVGSQLF